MTLWWLVEQAKGTEDTQASEDITQPPAEVNSITEGGLSSPIFVSLYYSLPPSEM